MRYVGSIQGSIGSILRNNMESSTFQMAPVGIHSRKLTWKPKKGPIKTTVLLKGDNMGFHVSLGECTLTGCILSPLGYRSLAVNTCCLIRATPSGSASLALN